MRRELEGRPLIWLALALMGGMAAHFYPVYAFVGLGCLLVDRRAGLWAIGLGFAILGVILGPRQPTLIVERGDFGGAVSVVSAPRPNRNGEGAIVVAGGQRLVMYYGADQPVSYGDTLLVKGRIQPLSPKGREYWRHQSVSGVLMVSDPVTRYAKGPPIFEWGQKIRRSFVAYTKETLQPRARAIVQSVCFNHDAELSLEDRETLAKSGIIHIISTSGMHVILVAGFLSLLLSHAPVPRWFQVGLLILVLIIYGAAASFRPPMLRSIIMAGLWQSAYLTKHEADGLSSTAASAIITLICIPTAVFDIGFLLSFAAISALVMWPPPIIPSVTTALQYLTFRAKQSAFASAVASLATIPLLSMAFRQFSIVGVVANLIVAPFIPIIVCGSILAWLAGGSFGELVMKGLVGPLALFCSGVATLIGNLPFAAIQTPPIPAWAVICAYVFAAMLWRPFKRPANDVAT